MLVFGCIVNRLVWLIVVNMSVLLLVVCIMVVLLLWVVCCCWSCYFGDVFGLGGGFGLDFVYDGVVGEGCFVGVVGCE